MQDKTTEMTRQIFAATERLMAKHGLHYLSMHKIAREAGISAGTIYVYFKNKEELLELLGRHVFDCFREEIAKNVDYSASAFEQYRQMWWNLWNTFRTNPHIASNIYQYQALPNFHNVVQEYKSSENNPWHKFCQQAKEKDMVFDLPSDLLFALSLESACNLSFDAARDEKTEFPTALLETVIERSWRAIQK